MENKTFLTTHQTVFISTIIVIIIGGWFYWFEYLPSKTQQACSDYLWERSVVNNDTDIYEDYLKVCINSGGPENFKQITDAAIVQAKIEKEEKASKEASTQAKEVQIVTTPSDN